MDQEYRIAGASAVIWLSSAVAILKSPFRQGRLTTAEAQGREAERERDRLAEKVSELDKLVVTSQTKLVVLEKELAQDKTAASYESAEKRRAQEGFHEINERYGKLLSKVQELESQLETERNHSVQAR
eukprot:SAG31_NODE_295_length_18239_cov_15.063065_9_plen_128_part_00